MLPEIQDIQTKDNIVSQFMGLNQTDTSNDQMFKDMGNMTSDEYPYLAPRKSNAIRRAMSGNYYSVLGSVVYGEDIYTVQGYNQSGTPHAKFYKNFEEVSEVTLEQSMNIRQMVVFGAYIVIFPDNVMYNAETEEVTNMSYEISVSGYDSNRMYLSDKDGAPFILDQKTKDEQDPSDVNFSQIFSYYSNQGDNIRNCDISITSHITKNYFYDDYCKFVGMRTQEYYGQPSINAYKFNLMANLKEDIINIQDNTTYPVYWIEKSGGEYFIKRFQKQNNAWYPADLYVSWRLTTAQYNAIKDKVNIGDFIKLHALKSDNTEYEDNDFNGKEATWNLIKRFKEGIKVENIITNNGGVILVFSNASLNFLKVLQEGTARFVFDHWDAYASVDAGNELTLVRNGFYFPGGDNAASLAYKLKLEKTVPQMDYITVSQNRIWGCSSDNHEIYSCKQGDATSWYQYAGLSSDSYAVTIPSGDPFTGAVTYSDAPYFFTENMAYSVMGNKPKNYQVQNYELRGVEDGAYRTIAQKDGYVYYKSKSGIERFNGNNAQSLTDYIDTEGLKGYIGAVNNDKYFLFMGVSGNADLYVYDIKKRLWHKDRNDIPMNLIELDNNLYLLRGTAGTLDVIKLNGKAKEVADVLVDNEPTYDTPKWYVESGEFNGDSILHKYITKFMFELKLEQGSKLSISFMYDDSGEWEEVFRTTDRQVKKLMKVPINVRRCERMRYKIEGEGQAKIYTLTITFEGGSEIG